MSTLIKDIRIVNEGRIAEGSVLIDGKTIASVLLASDPDYDRKVMDAAGSADEVITGGEDAMLLPGVIDDQVHFREPGATAKGCIASESRRLSSAAPHPSWTCPTTILRPRL